MVPMFEDHGKNDLKRGLAQTNIPNGVAAELDPRSMGNWEPQNHPKMVGMCRNQLENYGRNTADGFSAMRLMRPLSPAELLPRQRVGNDSPSKRGENPKNRFPSR